VPWVDTTVSPRWTPVCPQVVVPGWTPPCPPGNGSTTLFCPLEGHGCAPWRTTTMSSVWTQPRPQPRDTLSRCFTSPRREDPRRTLPCPRPRGSSAGQMLHVPKTPRGHCHVPNCPWDQASPLLPPLTFPHRLPGHRAPVHVGCPSLPRHPQTVDPPLGLRLHPPHLHTQRPVPHLQRLRP